MSSSGVLSKYECDVLEDPTEHRSLVGALQYCTNSRPEISFAVNKACQFLQRPTHLHLKAVKRIIRYLKGTGSHGITFTARDSLHISCFTDADRSSCLDDRKSTEVEYRALANGAAEVLWLQKLLTELQVEFQKLSVLYCDNLSSIQLISNHIIHARTKHVEIDYHFVREKVVDGSFVVQHVHSEDQIADPCTKLIPVQRFVALRSKLTVSSRLESAYIRVREVVVHVKAIIAEKVKLEWKTHEGRDLTESVESIEIEEDEVSEVSSEKDSTG
ncbi:hypothetical protein MLD38_003494 [Melastoma candidum]|uniref:Uncharacterized protein n=1 Tax=Melastoma candidum TaxID=119954 RepID=A0ACB9S440_9MYRT|nr:hypothetical protein MLD38_003494 [Melastoma candidum]